jgi:hypothetical protein
MLYLLKLIAMYSNARNEGSGETIRFPPTAGGLPEKARPYGKKMLLKEPNVIVVPDSLPPFLVKIVSYNTKMSIGGNGEGLKKVIILFLGRK